jgi:hypothetical protein
MMSVMGLESTGSRMPPDRDTERSRQTNPRRVEAPRPAPKTSNRFDAHAAASGLPSADMRDALSEAIRSIILPRLVAAGKARDLGLAHEGKGITEHDVTTMLAHILTPDHSVAEAMLTLLKLRGAPRTEIQTGLLLAVGRRLHAMRRGGNSSPSETLLALGRLQRLARSKALPDHGPVGADAATGSVLVVRFPDDSATLPATILEDMFRGAGWNVRLWTGPTFDEFPTLVNDLACDVVVVAMPADAAPGRDLDPALHRLSSRPIIAVVSNDAGMATDMEAKVHGRTIVRHFREAISAAAALL